MKEDHLTEWTFDLSLSERQRSVEHKVVCDREEPIDLLNRDFVQGTKGSGAMCRLFEDEDLINCIESWLNPRRSKLVVAMN